MHMLRFGFLCWSVQGTALLSLSQALAQRWATNTTVKEVIDNYLTNMSSTAIEKDTKMDVLTSNFLRVLL